MNRAPSLPIDLASVRRLFFVGIGGAGMSALARHFQLEGREVRGYDRQPSEFTALLERAGVQVTYEPTAESLVQGGVPDLVVYTPAVAPGQPLLVRARELGCPLLKRAQVLGLLSLHSRTLAVAGTHGKTTISTMAAHLLRECGVDATAFLGGVSINIEGNYAHGSSRLMVVEADEYDRSFLHLHPTVAVVTFTEPDHLDVYGDAASVLEAYREFTRLLPREGVLLVRHEDPARLQLPTEARRLSYGLSDTADCRAAAVRVERGAYIFDYHSPWGDIRGLRLRLPGRHNVQNACAALAGALSLGADPHRLPSALSSFLGTRRRFEKLYESSALLLVDDYAHHPTELRAIVQAAREIHGNRRLCVIFQPHLYSRTRDFADDFGLALGAADRAHVLPIYAARESPLPGVDSGLIARHVGNGGLLGEDELPALLRSLEDEGDWIVICAGAGSISSLARSAALTLQRG